MMRKTFNNNSHRLLRVNELIKREISIFLQGMEWTDYGLEGLNLTFTDVECSKDIRIAKIFYIPEGIKNSDLIKKAIILPHQFYTMQTESMFTNHHDLIHGYKEDSLNYIN